MEDKDSTRLSRDAWIEAAYKAFETRGIDGVKADPLAKQLGVTRGSFYWHFKNVSDLMQAVLQRWKVDQTDQLIAAIEETGRDPAQKLKRLLETCAEDDGRFEVGIRLWMASDPDARDVVKEVDAKRTGYIADLLRKAGRSDGERLAPVVYSAWLGEYSGAVQHSADERIKTMHALFDLLMAGRS